MSPKLPIGVATIYRPLTKFFCVSILFFIVSSCTPQTFPQEEILSEPKIQKPPVLEKKQNLILEKSQKKEYIVLSDIEIILPSNTNSLITKNFLNAAELSLYQKKANNISLNVNLYSNQNELDNIINKKAKPGKIFIGPLTSRDTKDLNKWCNKKVIFFSFASDRSLARQCVFLINFFPEDELRVLFEYFGNDKKIALLYPQNDYGNYISNIIDDIATESNSILINKIAYKDDLSDARDAIKELGKYELRKYELERQKTILQNKSDDVSKRALKKIEKFETTGSLDFTHLIIPDYNIRLLQIAPLLPFYDVDPIKVQFVGTGVWDDIAFFYEPALQGAVFPGISVEKRIDFINEYETIYSEQPIRTITIMHDLVGLVSFINEKKLTINLTLDLLNNNTITFDGMDGIFSFEQNLITRQLNILQITEGKTKKLY